MAKNNWPLEPHDLCKILPAMGDEQYKQLKASIKNSGFDPKHPIILYEGKILDGANRYTAAEACKIIPPTKQYDGNDPIGFVIQENLARRQLTPSQAAAAAAELASRMKAAAKAAKDAKKQAAKDTKGKGKPAKKEPKAKRTKNAAGTVSAQAAAKVGGTSERSTAAAEQLQKDSPELFAKVKAGEMKLNAAVKLAAKQKSDADKKSGVSAAAKLQLEKLSDAAFALHCEKHLTGKDLTKISGLTKEEIARIRPLIEGGWAVAAAMSYRATELSPTHPMRAFIDRAVAQGGAFFWSVRAYDKDFEVEIKVKGEPAKSEDDIPA